MKVVLLIKNVCEFNLICGASQVIWIMSDENKVSNIHVVSGRGVCDVDTFALSMLCRKRERVRLQVLTTFYI